MKQMKHESHRAALNCLVEESQIGGELHVQQQLLHQRANLPGDPSESVSDIGGFLKELGRGQQHNIP